MLLRRRDPAYSRPSGQAKERPRQENDEDPRVFRRDPLQQKQLWQGCPAAAINDLFNRLFHIESQLTTAFLAESDRE